MAATWDSASLMRCSTVGRGRRRGPAIAESYLVGRQPATSLGRLGKVLACLGDDASANAVQRTRNQRPRRFRVSAAAETLREAVHIHGPRTAEGHLHLPVAEIAEEDRHPGSRDRPRMLGDAIELLGAQR